MTLLAVILQIKADLFSAIAKNCGMWGMSFLHFWRETCQKKF